MVRPADHLGAEIIDIDHGYFVSAHQKSSTLRIILGKSLSLSFNVKNHKNSITPILIGVYKRVLFFWV